MNILRSVSLACILCAILEVAPSLAILCITCSSSNAINSNVDEKCLLADYSDNEIPSQPCDGMCYTKKTEDRIERGCHILDESNPVDQCIHNYGCHGPRGNTSCLVCCNGAMCNKGDPEVIVSEWDKCFDCSMDAEGDSCTEDGFNPYDSQMSYTACPGDCDTVSVPALPNFGLANPSFIRSCTVPYLVNRVVCDPAATIEGDGEVCKEDNYGRKNPKGRTCCCKGDFCNGPITPTFAPTTMAAPITPAFAPTTMAAPTTPRPIVVITQEETSGPVEMTMNSRLTSTLASNLTTEGNTSAKTFALYFILSLNFLAVFCCLLC